jgi:RND family efflux transporter MFP subunit
MFIRVIAFCVVVFFISSCNDKKNSDSKQSIQKTKVEVYVIKDEFPPIWIDFPAKTKASKRVNVSARVDGVLKEKYFKAGSVVKEGDLLYTIEDDKYKVMLEKAEANKRRDTASLKLIKSSLKRYKPLVRKSFATKEKLDQLQSKEEELEAIIKSDMAAIKQSKLNLSYTKVRASINGTIGKSLIDIGSLVGSNAQNSVLATIIQSDPLHVEFSASSDYVFLINKYKSQANPKVEVFIPSREDMGSHTGYLDFIDNQTNSSTDTVSMRATIDNKDKFLLAGTFVKIKIFISDSLPVYVLSPNNTMENQLGLYVYVVDEQGKLQIKQIRASSFSSNMLDIDKKTLNAGDKVVVSSTLKLREGMVVEFKEVKNPILR